MGLPSGSFQTRWLPFDREMGVGGLQQEPSTVAPYQAVSRTEYPLPTSLLSLMTFKYW